MNKELALITGASSGIGMELAKIMARKGHDLILVARRKEAMETLAVELRETHAISVTVFEKDLSRPAASQELYTDIKAADLEVSILVNNAGFGYKANFVDAPQQSSLDMLQLNITSLTDLTRLFLPDMIARKRGKLMHVGSTGSFSPIPTMSVYGATKAYVLSFNDALSEELRGTGVTTTVLCPGATITGFGKHADVETSFMFRFTAMTADTVARQAYNAMMKGKRRIITGLFNKLMVLSIPFVPSGMLLKMSKILMSGK